MHANYCIDACHLFTQGASGAVAKTAFLQHELHAVETDLMPLNVGLLSYLKKAVI